MKKYSNVKYFVVDKNQNVVLRNGNITQVGKFFNCTDANIHYRKQTYGFPNEYKGFTIHDQNTFKQTAISKGNNMKNNLKYSITTPGGAKRTDLSHNEVQTMIREYDKSAVVPTASQVYPINVSGFEVDVSREKSSVVEPKVIVENSAPNTDQALDKNFFNQFVPEGNKGVSRQQWEVLRRYYNGMSKNDIANDLGLSVKTITGHMGRLYKRFDVVNKKQFDTLLNKIRRSRKSPVATVDIEVSAPKVVSQQSKFVSPTDVTFAIQRTNDGNLLMGQSMNQTIEYCSIRQDVLESHIKRYGLPIQIDNYRIYDSSNYNKNLMNGKGQPSPTTLPNRVIGDYYVFDSKNKESHSELTKTDLKAIVGKFDTSALNGTLPVTLQQRYTVFNDLNMFNVYKKHIGSSEQKVETVDVDVTEPKSSENSVVAFLKRKLFSNT